MISVLINSRDPAKSARIHAHYTELLSRHDHEIIIVPNAKSMAEGYNRAFRQVSPRCSTVIYSHDDIEVCRDKLPQHLEELMSHYGNDVVGVAGAHRIIGPSWIQAGPPYIDGGVIHATPRCFSVCLYGSQRCLGSPVAMDGLFLACRRNVVERLGGWDERFGWHCADVDFTYRASDAEFDLCIADTIPIIHASGGNFGEAWAIDAAKFMAKHGPTLHQQKPRPFQFSAVEVATKAEALEVLSAGE